MLGRFAKLSGFARGSIFGVEGQNILHRDAVTPPTLQYSSEEERRTPSATSAACFYQLLVFAGQFCPQLRIFNVQPQYPHNPDSYFQFTMETQFVLRELHLPLSYSTLHVSLCFVIVTLLQTHAVIAQPLILQLYATLWLPQSQCWGSLMLRSHCTGFSVRRQAMGVQ